MVLLDANVEQVSPGLLWELEDAGVGTRQPQPSIWLDAVHGPSVLADARREPGNPIFSANRNLIAIIQRTICLTFNWITQSGFTINQYNPVVDSLSCISDYRFLPPPFLLSRLESLETTRPRERPIRGGVHTAITTPCAAGRMRSC